MGFNSGLKG